MTIARAAAGFAGFGVTWSAWTVAAPEIRTDFGLDDSALGLILTGLNLVALFVLPLAARASASLGAFTAARIGLLGLAACWAAAGLAGALPIFVAVVLVAGAGSALCEVALNAGGIEVDRQASRPVLGFLHAGFSVGSLVWVLVGSALVQAGGGRTAILLAAAAAIVILAFVWPEGRPKQPDSPTTERLGILALFRTRPALIPLAVLVGVALFSEVAVAAWSVVYLRGDLETAPVVAGVVAACFALAMLTGRLALPAMERRWSERRILTACSALLTAAGLVLVATTAVPAVAVGFALAGLAVGPMIPAAMRSAGEVAPDAVDHAAAAVNVFGYLGLLLAPFLVGVIADAASLRIGLATLAVAGVVGLAAVVGLARIVRSAQNVGSPT